MENPHIAPEHRAIVVKVASTPGYYVDNCPRCYLPHPDCRCDERRQPSVDSDRRPS